jgi:hypothetical protein
MGGRRRGLFRLPSAATESIRDFSLLNRCYDGLALDSGSACEITVLDGDG